MILPWPDRICSLPRLPTSAPNVVFSGEICEDPEYLVRFWLSLKIKRFRTPCFGNSFLRRVTIFSTEMLQFRRRLSGLILVAKQQWLKWKSATRDHSLAPFFKFWFLSLDGGWIPCPLMLTKIADSDFEKRLGGVVASPSWNHRWVIVRLREVFLTCCGRIEMQGHQKLIGKRFCP